MMLTKIYLPLFLKMFHILQIRSNEVKGAGLNKSSRIPAKIEYGKHYVTRTFSTHSLRSAPDQPTTNKKRIRVRRIRKTTETPTTQHVTTSPVISSSNSFSIVDVMSRSHKYSTNWKRYFTDFKAVTAPYPLRLFPEILEEKHYLKKWWDPRHTEWFIYFTGHTVYTRYLPFTLRMYPLKVLHTEHQLGK